MNEVTRNLEDCGTERNWYKSKGKVLMVIKAPSGRTLALISKTNPGLTTDAQLETIRRFMQEERP